MKIRPWVIVVAVIVIAVAAAIIYLIYTNNNDSYIYKITYRDEFTPGAKYVFYINENYNVKAVKESYCTTMECIETGSTSNIESYSVNISYKNKEIFKAFLKGLFNNEEIEIELSSLYISDNDEQIINALKYNDEVFFDYYEKEAKHIGELAYNLTLNKKNRVYIKENEKYVAYLVLHNNFNGTGNTYLLRENVIGGTDGYIEDYNGSIMKETIYNGQLKMKKYARYETTEVDNFLNNEFLQRFDEFLLDKILDTELLLYDSALERNVYTIKRKFFIPSLTELGCTTTFDETIEDYTELEYFGTNEDLIAQNEAGIEVPWWTRSQYDGYCWISGGTHKTLTGTDARYGVRPAFIVDSDTKINKILISDFNKEVYILL